jgi:chorismate dehydratase
VTQPLNPAAAAETLRNYRIGSVPYLNARPLTEGIADQLSYDIPSRLAARFAAGELDAALVPVFEAVSRDHALVAEGMAIASRGEVYSVFLAHQEPLAELESVALDPASRTSSHLVQCVLAEFHGLDPDYSVGPGDDAQARVIIGDPAIAFRREHTDGQWHILDLGAEWMRCTGLPFVFACWVLREGLDDLSGIAEALRTVKAAGLAARERIAAAEPDPAFAQKYLTDYIRFDLGEEEKRAIALFAALLRKHGLVSSAKDAEIRYV